MKLRLVGHDYKYAVEQIMLSLFPDERPDYSDDCGNAPSELVATSTLRLGKAFAQVSTTISCGETIFRGTARVHVSRLTDKIMTGRLLQRIVKQSFFRAAEGVIDAPPVWGSLTGIRPAHMAVSAIKGTGSVKAAIRTLTHEYYVSPSRAQMCVQAAQMSIKLKETLSPVDIALYVGIPFCPTRCAYCSFVSNSVEKSFDLIEPFVQVLLNEIKTAGEMVKASGLRVSSVYLGGGTPTALSEEDLDAVLSALQSFFDLAYLREYTVEAGRPDTLTKPKLDILHRHGVGRVCVNPQSMSDGVLNVIGRRHTAQDVLNAAHLVRQSGAALNMDIIAGLPSDTPSCFRHTIDEVLKLNPENVTIHTLSLKKGSRIMLEGTEIPSGSDVGLMLDYASNRLCENGFSPYYLYRQKFTSGGFENTGWCLPGHEGIYNVCMMEELCSVLALGGGGVTKLVSEGGRIERIFNAKYPKEYILFADKMKDKYEKIMRFMSMEEAVRHRHERDDY